MTDTEETQDRQVRRPAKIRTSITIRPDYLERAKEQGPSVSGVIDRALTILFTDTVLGPPGHGDA